MRIFLLDVVVLDSYPTRYSTKVGAVYNIFLRDTRGKIIKVTDTLAVSLTFTSRGPFPALQTCYLFETDLCFLSVPKMPL